MDINKPNQPFAIACVLDFKTVNILLNLNYHLFLN